MMKTADSKVPQHVAIIMDGNGRWAQRRGLPRIRGHQVGTESVRTIVRACKKAGVKYLTLYAFSVENWVRPKTEIRGLMRILKHFLTKEEKELHDNQVRLRVIGRLHDLPPDVQAELKRVMKATEHYTGGQLILALSYGGRAELVDAVRSIARKVKKGDLAPDSIDDKTIAESLYAPDVPDPDLMIRTSGELRISNFLLWQLSYSEFYVTDVLWPDFREAEFAKALEAYSQRHRRFGDVK
jgi:undecaprenyl diphosphate synthase